jgi:large subunit ribosomal protein L22
MAEGTQPQATEAVAHLKFARMAPRKLRRVADAIRDKRVQEALVLLQFAGVFAAQPLEKLVRSAVANAENNHNMNTDDLYVARIMVDGGPGGKFTKRLDPRAQGRANFKRKRLSHVTVVVSEKPPRRIKPSRGGAAISLKRQSRRAAAAAQAPAKKAGTRKKSAPRKKTARKATERT